MSADMVTDSSWPPLSLCDMHASEMAVAASRVATRTPWEVRITTASGARVLIRVEPGHRTTPAHFHDMQFMAEQLGDDVTRRLNHL